MSCESTARDQKPTKATETPNHDSHRIHTLSIRHNRIHLEHLQSLLACWVPANQDDDRVGEC